jgi:ketosteroid isomerase-like protein
MSQENVEIVRAAIESFNRGDLDTLLREMPPEIEWHDQPELPGSWR